jgi:hypothetical protein
VVPWLPRNDGTATASGSGRGGGRGSGSANVIKPTGTTPTLFQRYGEWRRW